MNNGKISILFFSCILLYIFIPLFLVPLGSNYRFIILNVFWLYILLNYFLQRKIGIAKEVFQNHPDQFSLSILLKEHKHLLYIILINIGLHIYPMISRTIMLRTDESTLVQHGLGLFTRISSAFRDYLSIDFLWTTRLLYLLTLILLIIFWAHIKTIFRKISRLLHHNVLVKISFLVALIILSYVYFYMIKGMVFNEALYRFPPVSKFLILLNFTIFGVEEFAPRLIQLFLGTAGAIYIYRLILLYYSKKAAILGVIIFLFNPLVFEKISYAVLGIGTISITIIITFYFVRFLKDRLDNDLLLTFMFIGMGFLYKRVIILLLILIPAYILLFNYEYFKNNLRKIVKLIWFALIPIVPYFLLSKYLSSSYVMDFTRLINIHLFDYFILLRTQLSWAMFVIFILSIAYIVISERNKLNNYLLYNFGCFYVFYTIYPWDNINRFSLAFIPTAAIFIAVFVSGLLKRKKVLLNIVIIIFAVYLLLISTIIKLPEIQPQFVLYKNFLHGHYPLDEAAAFIKESNHAGKVLGLEVTGFAFYRDKMNIEKEKLIEMSVGEFNDYTPNQIKEITGNNDVYCIMTTNGRLPYKIENIDSNTFSVRKEFIYKNGNKVSLYIKPNNE